MNEADPVLLQAMIVATRLVGSWIDDVSPVGGGRNARVYCVRCQDRSYALKHYPRRQDDPRDGLMAELSALQLMLDAGIETVPRAITADREHDFLLLSWIDGAHVGEPSAEDVDAASRFLDNVQALSFRPDAASLPEAAEACLSGAEIERQILRRLQPLQRDCLQEPSLQEFLDRDFAPALQSLLEEAKGELRAAGLDFDRTLPLDRRRLIPADFGFHNTLRLADGSLVFLDFEYFGWDDPAKLTADFLLHPGMELPLVLKERFRSAALRRYGEDAAFAARLSALTPLFGLRWVLILLNEFVPERWRRRVEAGTKAGWSEAKAEQLMRARQLLERLRAGKTE